MSKIKKILITGAGGYVGTSLVPFLINNGYQITCLDLFIYGKSYFKESNNLKIIKGDIRDEKTIIRSTKNQDAIIHLACISNDPSFELNPDLGKSINYDAFEPLVNISKSNGVSRFIYASSSSVYGIKKIKNVEEDMKLEPLTDYSKYKALCEDILLKYTSNDFIGTIIRPATVCGFSPRLRLDVVVNLLTNLAFFKRKISVFGGSQLRPNIHMYDMIRSYYSLLVADANLVNNEAFNVGSENISVMEIANLVQNVVGDDIKIETTKSNDNRSYHISSKKIEKILGFKSEKTIRNAIEDLTNFFQKNSINDTFSNPKYININTMKKINLE